MIRQPPVERLKSKAKEAASLMKTLSHPNRVLIACALASGELGVGEIAKITGIAQPTISRDLARFKSAQLVETRRQSKAIFYRLADRRLAALIDALGEAFGVDSNAAGEANRKRRQTPNQGG